MMLKILIEEKDFRPNHIQKTRQKYLEPLKD